MRKPHGCHRRAKSGSSNNNTATAISCYFHTGGKLPSSGHTAESLRPPLTRLHARTPNVVNLDHAGNPSGAKLAASPPAKIVRRRILHLVSYRIGIHHAHAHVSRNRAIRSSQRVLANLVRSSAHRNKRENIPHRQSTEMYP
jgi:hypothetical protein